MRTGEEKRIAAAGVLWLAALACAAGGDVPAEPRLFRTRLRIEPELVDMTQAQADYSFRTSPHFWADLTGKKPDPACTVPLVAMEYFATGSYTGVRGDPSKATAEKGHAALEAAADEVAAIVDEMRARAIMAPPDHHDAEVEALKRQARAAGIR